jgi:phospholipase D1/2
MAGKPFKVGRFAHTLRVRLMREHLGVDVDAQYEEDLMASQPVQPADQQEEWDPENEQEHGKEGGVTNVGHKEKRTAMKTAVADATTAAAQGGKGFAFISHR